MAFTKFKKGWLISFSHFEHLLMVIPTNFWFSMTEHVMCHKCLGSRCWISPKSFPWLDKILHPYFPCVINHPSCDSNPHYNTYTQTLFWLYNAKHNNSGINANPCTQVSISRPNNSKWYKHLLFLALPSFPPITLTSSLHNLPSSSSNSFHLLSTSPLYFKSKPCSFTLHHHCLATPSPYNPVYSHCGGTPM